VGTDLQGNWDDYAALKAIYLREDAAGNHPNLLLCGDLVHGPGENLADPDRWPNYLGSYYRDRSAELLVDFEAFTRDHRGLALLGNHEHAHIGGPTVSKFHPDEAAVLDAHLGSAREGMHAFMRTFPLLAVAPCGAVCCHAAPRRTEKNLEAFERIQYAGHEGDEIEDMLEGGTLGALLWARGAEPRQARALLRATQLDARPQAFCVFGHDVVREGYVFIGDEQLCLSTSFGCDDRDKHYLRLDLSRRYQSVHDLRPGIELRRLYPDAR